MHRVQRRCVGFTHEGGWTTEQTCMALLQVFLLFSVLSPENEAQGDPQPLPWELLVLLE